MIANLGSIPIFMILIFLQLLLLFCLVKTVKNRRIHNFSQVKIEEFKWSGFNNFIFETNLAVIFAFVINLSKVSADTGADITNNTFAALMAIVYVI